MQGFPDSFEFPVSNTAAMKQLGNSVAVPVIQAVGKSIIDVLWCDLIRGYIKQSYSFLNSRIEEKQF